MKKECKKEKPTRAGIHKDKTLIKRKSNSKTRN